MTETRPSDVLRSIRSLLICALDTRTPLSLEDVRILNDAIPEIVSAVVVLERAVEAMTDEAPNNRAARAARARAACNIGGNVVTFPVAARPQLHVVGNGCPDGVA